MRALTRWTARLFVSTSEGRGIKSSRQQWNNRDRRRIVYGWRQYLHWRHLFREQTAFNRWQWTHQVLAAKESYVVVYLLLTAIRKRVLGERTFCTDCQCIKAYRAKAKSKCFIHLFTLLVLLAWAGFFKQLIEKCTINWTDQRLIISQDFMWRVLKDCFEILTVDTSINAWLASVGFQWLRERERKKLSCAFSLHANSLQSVYMCVRKPKALVRRGRVSSLQIGTMDSESHSAVADSSVTDPPGHDVAVLESTPNDRPKNGTFVKRFMSWNLVSKLWLRSEQSSLFSETPIQWPIKFFHTDSESFTSFKLPSKLIFTKLCLFLQETYWSRHPFFICLSACLCLCLCQLVFGSVS